MLRTENTRYCFQTQDSRPFELFYVECRLRLGTRIARIRHTEGIDQKFLVEEHVNYTGTMVRNQVSRHYRRAIAAEYEGSGSLKEKGKIESDLAIRQPGGGLTWLWSASGSRPWRSVMQRHTKSSTFSLTNRVGLSQPYMQHQRQPLKTPCQSQERLWERSPSSSGDWAGAKTAHKKTNQILDKTSTNRRSEGAIGKDSSLIFRNVPFHHILEQIRESTINRFEA